MSGTNGAVHLADSKTVLTLSKNTAAIQIVPDRNGRIRLGTLMQLPGGASLEVIGEGFDQHTARVAWEGSSYYIFLEEEVKEPLRSMAQRAG